MLVLLASRVAVWAAGEYAVEVVRGMQEGDDPDWPLKIHATLKQCVSTIPTARTTLKIPCRLLPPE